MGFRPKRPSFTVPRPYACSSCRARLERPPNAPRCSAYAADLGFRIYGLGCRAFFAKRRNVSRGSVSTLFGTFSARFRAWRGGFEVQKGGCPRFDAAVVLLTVTHAVAVVIEDAESPLRVLRLLRVFRRWHSQAFSLDYEAKRNAFSASKP